MFEFLRNSNKKDSTGNQLRVNVESSEQLDDILALSQENNVYIFKHSSRCGISSVVLNRFEKQVKEKNETYFHVHIQGNRSLSNRIAEELQIRHESPQLIVLKNARVLAHGSHYDILEIVPSL
ncbi:bacillithiol system redox-active protein YtxJ [Lutimonas vermicola]|uniref:Bacillithiol system redox-active protein YtxJ n=1 Tax=Lutimonas vermicola TaxID=414288 RepID=A0ABU9KWQ1_9FLAO